MRSREAREADLVEQPVERVGAALHVADHVVHADRFCYAACPTPLRPRMDVALLLFLIFLNALFAMSEMALTASRKARLQVMVEAGDSGRQPRDGPARRADQVALGGADRHHLDQHPQRHRRRRRLLGAVRALAARDLRHAATAPPRSPRPAWSSSASPSSASSSASWCPSGSACSTRRRSPGWCRGRWSSWRWSPGRSSSCSPGAPRPRCKLLGVRGAPDRSVTEEEIAASLEEGLDAGVIEAQEHQMVRNVFRLDDRQVGSMMIPRAEIVWLEATATPEDVLRIIADAEHSRYPVCRGGLDDVLGVVSAQSLLQQVDPGPAVRARGAPAVAGVRARDALRHGAARAVPGLERAARVRGRRVRRGAGNDHGARRARGDHRRVQHRRSTPTPGRCGATTAAGCSTA